MPPLSARAGVYFGVHSSAGRLDEEDLVLEEELEDCIST